MSIPLELNPTARSVGYGGLFISRLVPGDGELYLEWEHNGEFIRKGGEFLINIKEPGTSFSMILYAGYDKRSANIKGLSNGVDYSVNLTGYQKGVKTAQAPVRLFRPCPVPGVTVAYCHPDDYTFNSSGRSTCSPSILRLPNGRLLVSHDFYWHLGGQNLTHVYYSDDDGLSWHYLSRIYPCFWGKLFRHQDALFILACSTEYGNFQIFRSLDAGKTWSEPVIIIPGHGESRPDLPGPLQCPTPITIHEGRLWTSVEYGCFGIPGLFDAAVVSIALEDDPMIASNWVTTPFARYNPDYPGAVKGGNPGHFEGNVVAAPGGDLLNILRYDTHGSEPDYGRAFIYRIDRRNPGSPLIFDRIIDFPGNMSKFEILRDPENGLYLCLFNRVTLAWRHQRNILSLSVSEDLYHWKVIKDLINYQDSCWPEGFKLAGFQYPDFFIENGTIYYVSRTALGGAYNFHNANRITFHRLDNYEQYL
jgi:hypothetical protein